MYPESFEYVRASSVDDALTELSARDDARLLAGGHGLVPDLKQHRASAGLLVDIGHLDALAGVATDDAAGDAAVEVGALTTHARLAANDAVWDRSPVLAEAAATLGDRQVRNRGTIGGNLAEADPEADLPAAVLAADATLHVRSGAGERRVPVDDFFRGRGETALGSDELLTAIEVPARTDDGRAGGAYVRKTHPASGFAMVGVGATIAVEGKGEGEDEDEDEGMDESDDENENDIDTVTRVRVATTGATEHAVRLTAVEDALRDKSPTPEAVEAAADRAGERLNERSLHGDHHASAAYRRRLLAPYARRALATALDRAGSGNHHPDDRHEAADGRTDGGVDA